MVVLGVHTLDAKRFQECELFKTFEESNLKVFICNPLREMYSFLVKMFYSNLYFTNGILYSKVRKHKTSLLLEGFTEVLDLPHDGPRFKIDESRKGDNYMYKTFASFYFGIKFMCLFFIHCRLCAPENSFNSLSGKSSTLYKEEKL